MAPKIQTLDPSLFEALLPSLVMHHSIALHIDKTMPKILQHVKVPKVLRNRWLISARIGLHHVCVSCCFACRIHHWVRKLDRNVSRSWKKYKEKCVCALWPASFSHFSESAILPLPITFLCQLLFSSACTFLPTYSNLLLSKWLFTRFLEIAAEL